jgi:hypothetical protein
VHPSSERDPGPETDPGIGLAHAHFHIVEGEAAAPVRLILEHSFDPTL